jgi:poly(A) polymerase Pap1
MTSQKTSTFKNTTAKTSIFYLNIMLLLQKERHRIHINNSSSEYTELKQSFFNAKTSKYYSINCDVLLPCNYYRLY